MRCVGRNPTEKRIASPNLFFHPIRCSLKKHIGAVTACLLKNSVVQHPRPMVLVLRRIPTTSRIRLANTTSPMNKRLLKTSNPRLIKILISQMPLAKYTRAIPRPLQHIRNRYRIEPQPLTLQNRMGHSIEKFMPTGHQRRSCRCTSRRDKEILETATLSFKPIKVRCFQDRMPMPGCVPVALIVR